MRLAAGRRLGPYHVLSTLGSGGMGEVYRARDTKLGREVAIKVLADSVASKPSSLARLTREAHAIAALNHPHIVTIFSIEEAEGVRFITMELVEGDTLDKLIPREGVSLTRFFDIAIALSDALTAAHRKHLVHRFVLIGGPYSAGGCEAHVRQRPRCCRTHVRTSAGAKPP